MFVQKVQMGKESRCMHVNPASSPFTRLRSETYMHLDYWALAKEKKLGR
jgi:hypothetical protein